MRRPLAVAAVLVAAAALSGCGDDESSSESSSTSSAETSTTTAPSTSTSTPAGALTPEQAAKDFFAAWQADDSALAASYGTSSAIEQIFDIPQGAGQSLTFGSCAGGGGSVDCVWSRPGGSMTLTVNDGTGGAKVEVTAVRYGPAATTPTS